VHHQQKNARLVGGGWWVVEGVFFFPLLSLSLSPLFLSPFSIFSFHLPPLKKRRRKRKKEEKKQKWRWSKNVY
jgi:hypothetical protein